MSRRTTGRGCSSSARLRLPLPLLDYLAEQGYPTSELVGWAQAPAPAIQQAAAEAFGVL